MRKCKKCGVEQPLSQFEMHNKEKGYRRHECRSCTKARVRNWADKSRAHIKQYRQDYHQNNRAKIVGKVNEWVKNNPEKRRANALSYYYRLQDAAIMAYGGYKCGWCGIGEPLVLCIDHVENNGRAHRREIGSTGGAKLYKWLRDNHYPTGFQVLCMNCNHAKYRNGGTLPESLKGRCNDHS